MRERLEVQSEELAAAFRALSRETQRSVAASMVGGALAVQSPPLEVPGEPAAQRALVAKLDASEDEADFRRARAAAAAAFLTEGAFEDALYESLHARSDLPGAVGEALSLAR